MVTANHPRHQRLKRTFETGKLYLADAQGGRWGEGNDTICVGAGTGIPIALSQLTLDNGFGAGTFWLRSRLTSNYDCVLIAEPGKRVGGCPVIVVANADVPAFNLDLSSVLFASAAPAASLGGELETATATAMTLRYDAGTALGSALINAAKTDVIVNDAPLGTYLVVQSDSGAWAKAVEGTETINISGMGAGLTSFEGCKVWLETTDTEERLTTAAMATQGTADVTITLGANMTKTEGSGAQQQTGLTGAMTEVVYTADSGYYFPEDYSVAEVNGISVARNGFTQITVSGTPTADAAFTVRPKANLTAGTYNETLEVTTDKNTKASAAVSFTVKPKTVTAPKITKGAGGKWTKGSKNGLSFTSDGEYDSFQKVLVDGKGIDSAHYTSASGSTVVTLKAKYLETLAIGKHTLGIVSENGTAETEFTIQAKKVEPTLPNKPAAKPTPNEKATSNKTPQTGDNSNWLLWLALLALSGSAIGFICIKKKTT